MAKTLQELASAPTDSPHYNLAPAARWLLETGLSSDLPVKYYGQDTVLGVAVYLKRKGNDGSVTDPQRENPDLSNVTQIAVVKDAAWHALVVQNSDGTSDVVRHTGSSVPTSRPEPARSPLSVTEIYNAILPREESWATKSLAPPPRQPTAEELVAWRRKRDKDRVRQTSAKND